MFMEQYLKALFLGVLEGFTEFLPVSSTAHLLIASEWIDFKGPPGHVFEIFIQLGAIFAVLVLYRQKLLHVGLNWHRDKTARHFILILIVATIPALVAGALGRDYIKTHLYNPTVIGWALIIGGIVMIAFERLKRPSVFQDVDTLPLKTAALIGCFQTLALVPGVSRSGASIIGGLAAGLTRKSAAEFSFFLAIPVMFAAVLYDTLKSWDDIIASDGLMLMLTGFFAAFVTAMVVIRLALYVVGRFGFVPFGIYRIFAGSALLLFWPL
jgi:undecaprenyl-diphosphatase